MKYIYIVNRFQFKNKTDLILRTLHRISRKMKRDYEIVVNETPEEAHSSVRQFQNARHIITAIGGDGALNRVLNDLAGTDNILSFLPTGTGNDYYRTCRETLPDGIRDIDIVRINNRCFINTCCFGIDADIANDDRYIHNRLIPRPLRYHAGAVSHFFTFGKGRHLKVVWDGHEIEKDFMTIVAANGRYYGGGYKVSPDSLSNDGLMEIYLVDSISKIQMATMILSMKKAGHLKSPALKMIQTNELYVSSDQPIKANIDGEPITSDHFDLKLIPKGVKLDYNSKFINMFYKGIHAE